MVLDQIKIKQKTHAAPFRPTSNLHLSKVKDFNTVAVLFLWLPERSGAGFLWRLSEGGGSEGGTGSTEEEAPSGPAGPGEPLPACCLFPGRAHRTGGRRADWLRGNRKWSLHLLPIALARMPRCIDRFCSMSPTVNIWNCMEVRGAFHLIGMIRL